MITQQLELETLPFELDFETDPESALIGETELDEILSDLEGAWQESLADEITADELVSLASAEEVPGTRKGTTFVTRFTPGVMHNHTPTGRWSEVQADSRRRAGRLVDSVKSNPSRLASLSAEQASTAACALLSPDSVARVARHVVMRGMPMAQRHLDHYLDGSGKDLIVDLEDLIRRDVRLRARIAGAIRAARKASRRRGHLRISQNDYSVRDINFALGAIDRLDFEFDAPSGLVHLWFKDRYEWHPVGFGYRRLPGDVTRPTNCVHAAMVELKSSGAADYWMVGDVVVPAPLLLGGTSAPPAKAGAQSTSLEVDPEAELQPETLLDEILAEVTFSEVGATNYTVCDFIDPRIDVPAQYALHTLSKGDAESRKAALGILAAVKAARLEGVYREDRRAPAQRAIRLKTGYWKLIPPGQQAICLRQPAAELPMIVVRKSIAPDQPSKQDPAYTTLAQALRVAWPQCGLPNLPPPAPSGKPCVRPPKPTEIVFPDDPLHAKPPTPTGTGPMRQTCDNAEFMRYISTCQENLKKCIQKCDMDLKTFLSRVKDATSCGLCFGLKHPALIATCAAPLCGVLAYDLIDEYLRLTVCKQDCERVLKICQEIASNKTKCTLRTSS